MSNRLLSKSLRIDNQRLGWMISDSTQKLCISDPILLGIAIRQWDSNMKNCKQTADLNANHCMSLRRILALVK